MLDDIQKIVSHIPEREIQKKRLGEEELDELADKQLEFLELVFPFLPYRYSDEYLVLETRALKRTDGRGGTYLSFNSHNVATMKEYYKKYLEKCNKARTQNCQYYVFSALDKKAVPEDKYSIETPKNSRAIYTMAKADNVRMTQILALDFDNLTKEEFVEYYYRMREAGLEPNVIFSGNGYQCIFLLDEETRDLGLLERFCTLAGLSGYKVDLTVISKTQLLRMPYSYNSKLYDPKKNKGVEPHVIKTEWLVKSYVRYDVNDLFLKISGGLTDADGYYDFLHSIDLKDERELKQRLLGKEVKKKKEKEPKKEAKKETKKKETKAKKQRKTAEVGVVDVNIHDIYNNIDLTEFSIGVCNLLKGPIEGYANISLKFLTAFLKAQGYSLEDVIEVALNWAELDTFNWKWDDSDFVESEVIRFYNKGYKVAKADVAVLSEVYGAIELVNNDLYSIKDKVVFDNKTFRELKEITPTGFLLLCVMKAEALQANVKEFKESELARLSYKTEKTIRNNIDSLVELGFLTVEERKTDGKGRPSKVYVLQDVAIAEVQYTKMDVSKIKMLLFMTVNMDKERRISDRAFMLAIYLRYRAFGTKRSCYMKQENIAEEMGVTRTAINKAMTELENAKVIRKIEHDVYTTKEYVLMY